MDPDAKSEFAPDMDTTLKAIIDHKWLKLNSTKTGGGKPEGRWRNDS
jgi:hypothetical protein